MLNTSVIGIAGYVLDRNSRIFVCSYLVDLMGEGGGSVDAIDVKGIYGNVSMVTYIWSRTGDISTLSYNIRQFY